MGLSQERRPWKESNATCARPICEALPSCRGLRARHAQKECTGSWEIPRLTSGNVTPWPASGRRGAEADDARTREVGLRNRSCEAGEQGGAICCGVGGAKGGDRGECRSAKHTPGAGPGKCVTGAGTHTASCKAKEEGKVHRAFPPHQRRVAQAVVLRTQEGRRARGGRPDVAGLRGRPRSQYRRPARTGPERSVSGDAEPAALSTKARRPTATNRDCHPRRQDRPEGDCRGAEYDLRGRVPRLFVWVPPQAQSARCHARFGG